MAIEVELKLDNRDTLHLKVCNALRDAIIKGQFKPGERLKQSELAEKLGVSRMPIREALRKLESEGLVTLVPHKGAIVKTIHLADLQEVYTLRAELEKMACIQSAKLLTDSDLTRLIELVHLMEDCTDIDVFVDRNIEFHQLLLSHCHWERLNGFIDSLWNGLPQQTPHFITGQTATSNEEHHKMITAIKEKRYELAGELLSQHILRTGESLIQSLKKERAK